MEPGIKPSKSRVVVEVRRGSVVEARHLGALALATPAGDVTRRLGDTAARTTTRSTIKAIQALPLVLSGAAEHFGLNARELALMCASHSAEPMHTQTVLRILARAGLKPEDLQCGPHRPMHGPTAEAQLRAGQVPTNLDNNCSGKHTGMLLTCLHQGWPQANYLDPDHPLQRQILAHLQELADDPTIAVAGRDGCSAPTFGISVERLAVVAARMAAPTGPLGSSLMRLTRAMAAHPEMVGGSDRLDTALMQAAQGQLMCKIGAESSYVIAIFPGPAAPEGLGIAVKIADGGRRAVGPVVIETLRQLGVLDAQAVEALKAYHRPTLENCRGLCVGHVVAQVDLQAS